MSTQFCVVSLSINCKERKMATYTPEEIRQARENITELVEQAYEKIGEAEKLASKYNVGFSFNVEYGMGGYYDPTDGWQASSNSC